MATSEKAGGIGALIAAATFVIGIALFATALTDYTTGDPTAAESVAFVQDNQAVLYVWNFVIYIVFGAALVPLVVALRQRFQGIAPMTAHVAAAFGIIWAGLVIAAGMIANIGIGTVVDLANNGQSDAESVWATLDAVQNGIGGGNEIVGGIWVMLVSWMAIRVRAFPAALNYLGMASGAFGLTTIVPALEAAGAVFGIGLIVWFTWLGIVMLGDSEASAHEPAGK